MIQRLAPLALVLILAGCEKKEPPADAVPTEAPATTVVPPPAASAASAASAESADGALPTEEDFEAEAEKEVTAANLDAQLDALEKEINAE